MLEMGSISILYTVDGGERDDRPLPEPAEFDVATRAKSEVFDVLDADTSFDAILVDDVFGGSEFLGELLERVPDRPCVLVGDDTDPDALQKTIRTAVREGWSGYPIPADEHARLDCLDEYDFEQPTLLAHLEGLTTTARECFDADVGFVGVVDEDEEQFVTSQGVDWETLDRSDSICSHGLLDGEPLIISDLPEDSRVSYEPIHSEEFEPDFYAGIPLKAASGQHVGMLCVMDEETREFDEEDHSALQWLAEQAMVHVERYGRAS